MRNWTFRAKLGGLAAVVVAVAMVVGGASAAAGTKTKAPARAAKAVSGPVHARPTTFHQLAPPSVFYSPLATSVATDAGFEDADADLAPSALTDWNSFAPTTWSGTAPYQGTTKTSGPFEDASTSKPHRLSSRATSRTT